jgi:hypothetical protein
MQWLTTRYRKMVLTYGKALVTGTLAVLIIFTFCTAIAAESAFERIWTGSFRMTTEALSYAGFDCEQMVFWSYETPEKNSNDTYSLRLFLPEGAFDYPDDPRIWLDFTYHQTPKDALIYPGDSVDPVGALVIVFPEGDEVVFNLLSVHFMNEHADTFMIRYHTLQESVPGFTRRLLTETRPVGLRIEGELGVAEYVIPPEVILEFWRFRLHCLR